MVLRGAVIIRFFALCLLLGGLLAASQANASVVSTPHFKVDGLVIVWGASQADGTSSPTGQLGTKLTSRPAAFARAASPTIARPLITGTLAPVSGPDLVALTDTQMHFYVASNTAFSIDAELLNHANTSETDLRNTAFDLSVSLGTGANSYGSSAQYPHQSGARGGMAARVRTLADLTTRTRVFTGNQRTAARAGTIAEQSVRFDMGLSRRNGASGARFEPSPEIVFTVFVP